MDRNLKWCAALALAALVGTAAAGERVQEGREAFHRHCRTCHGGTAPADLPIGPNLTGAFGAKAGTRPGGSHSRAMTGSAMVWDREALRGFLATPRRVMPTAMMPDELVADEAELESLLDYLESLH